MRGSQNRYSRTRAPHPGFAAAHLFRPDSVEWGYRPRCEECGRERRDHPSVPRPRTPVRQQDEKEQRDA